MTKTMILIHGTWGTSEDWRHIKSDFEALDFDLVIPNLLYHDLPYAEIEANVGDVSLTQYADQIQALVEKCDEPPILIGHSLGCLVAQLVAERVDLAGMILLGPAPTGDIPAFYPTMVRAFLPHFLRWGFWKKPIPPYRRALQYAHSQHSPIEAELAYERSVPDSGLAYTQVAMALIDPQQTTHVNHSNISCPVFILVGQHDKLTVPAIAQATAKNYGDQATIIMSGEADHMYISETFKDQTTGLINRWLKSENLI